MTAPAEPTSFTLAVHESAHAVAGICLGRSRRLEWVSIIETVERKGGCKWNLEGHTAIPGEDFAIRFAGPLGQVIYLPTVLVTKSRNFEKPSIYHGNVC